MKRLNKDLLFYYIRGWRVLTFGLVEGRLLMKYPKINQTYVFNHVRSIAQSNVYFFFVFLLLGFFFFLNLDGFLKTLEVSLRYPVQPPCLLSISAIPSKGLPSFSGLRPISDCCPHDLLATNATGITMARGKRSRETNLILREKVVCYMPFN